MSRLNRGFTLLVLLLVLFFIITGGLLFLSRKKDTNEAQNIGGKTPILSPTLTQEEDFENWITYSSPRFSYSFKYPEDWFLLPYDEENPQIKFGSHTLLNYSPEEVQKYMNHGIVDWKKFLGEKPAVKIDFSVYSKKLNKIDDFEDFLKNSLNQSANKLSKSDLAIGSLETTHYKATEDLGPTDVPEANQFIATPDDDRLIIINLLFWNVSDYESLKNTKEWQTLAKITSSFNFTKGNTSQECGVCGPKGIHNVEGNSCAEGFVCKKGITTTVSYCVKNEDPVTKCESN